MSTFTILFCVDIILSPLSSSSMTTTLSYKKTIVTYSQKICHPLQGLPTTTGLQRSLQLQIQIFAHLSSLSKCPKRYLFPNLLTHPIQKA